MKLSKITGILTVTALALLAFTSSASATTLETNGVKQTSAIEMRWTIKSGTSTLLKDTSGAFGNTTVASTLIMKDSAAMTGTAVSGPISTLTFAGSTHEKIVVDKVGSISLEWIKGTTNGTVRWSGAEITEPATILGSVVTVNCVTSNTDIGTLTGVASGSATIDINAVLNCGSFLPSAKWEGTYVTTTSEGKAHAIGVVE